MMKKKQPHSSARKKSSALRSPSRTKKAATKATKSTRKAKAAKKEVEEEERARKRIELTLRAFRMAYESNKRGEFRRIQ